MPDLPSRREHEAAIVALLWGDFQEFRASKDRSWSSLGVRVQERLEPELETVFIVAAGSLASSMGALVSSERIAAEATYYSRAWAATVAIGVVDTTVDMLAAGTPLDVMLSKERAEKIAATEVTRAISAGEEAALVLVTLATSATFKAIWHTAEDERVCDVCAPLNGTGEEVYGAVSPSGPPSHPSCRCWLDYEESL